MDSKRLGTTALTDKNWVIFPNFTTIKARFHYERGMQYSLFY